MNSKVRIAHDTIGQADDARQPERDDDIRIAKGHTGTWIEGNGTHAWVRMDANNLVVKVWASAVEPMKVTR